MTVSDRVRIKDCSAPHVVRYGPLQKNVFVTCKKITGVAIIDPDGRKRGHGRVIMAAAEDWLRQAGIAKLQLLVRRENAQANAFYQSLGFEESTSVMFQKWLDGREQPR